ncbi:precorrin-3B synthase [Paraburkholderia sp. A1RI_3L]|uniref:precorrin-3B synthase n=1 Tax=Paraburkholderia TaxID=1822464 RepID=UPI003B7A1F8C
MSHDFSLSLRPSACPALTRIVNARDGGLCRIKLPGGELLAAQAVAIAEAASEHASGVIELTNRSNVQLRGVRAGHEAALIARLLAAGLGPRQLPGASPFASDASCNAPSLTPRLAAADDVRNVMVSPTAGRDAGALIDTRPLAAQLLALLEGEPRFAALSPKFALLLDGGEQLAALDHPHDIWLSAIAPEQHADETWFAFGLAGKPSCTQRCALAAVQTANVPALVRALLTLFLDLAGPDDTRMRHLVATHGEAALLEHLACRIDFPLRRDAAVDAWRRQPADASLRFGAHRQRDGERWYVGAQPPLGRLDAPALHELARLTEQVAAKHGRATLRATPWQGLLLPDLEAAALAQVERGLDALGLIQDARHPLARLVACAGSPGCVKAHADTKADALVLAPHLPADMNVEVHLSGCVRSCAAAHCAPYTLLAVEPGRYDVYRRIEQAAAQAPSDENEALDLALRPENPRFEHPRFGERLAAHLTLDEAARVLHAARPDAGVSSHA